MSEAKAPVTVSLTLDRSVNKVAGWLIGSLIAAIAISVLALATAWHAKDMAIKAETELRLVDDWLVQHGVEKRDGKYVFKEEKLNE